MDEGMTAPFRCAPPSFTTTTSSAMVHHRNAMDHHMSGRVPVAGGPAALGDKLVQRW
jgi:hypothetical protein